MLQRLHDEVTTDHFTLGWLIEQTGQALLRRHYAPARRGRDRTGRLDGRWPAPHDPGLSDGNGPACPVFPRIIAARPLPTRHLAALVQRAMPALKYLEKVIHPRWPSPHEVDEASCRHRRRDTKRDPGIHSGPLEQRRARDADRTHRPGLSPGGRAPALDRVAARRHRDDGRVRGGMGDSPRREMDNRLFLAHLGLSASGDKRRFKSPTFRVRLVSIIRLLGGLDDDIPGRR